MRGDYTETLMYTRLPREHWRRIRTGNAIGIQKTVMAKLPDMLYGSQINRIDISARQLLDGLTPEVRLTYEHDEKRRRALWMPTNAAHSVAPVNPPTSTATASMTYKDLSMPIHWQTISTT